MRSRITFSATEPCAGRFRLLLCGSIVRALRTGDLMHFARNASGDLAMSVLRNGELIVAVGAVCPVPLGPDIQARYPHDLVEQATAVFRQRDPEFNFIETPLEIVADRTFVLWRGRSGVAGADTVRCSMDFCGVFPAARHPLRSTATVRAPTALSARQ